MANGQTIAHVQAHFSRIYLGGIPSLLTDDGAFLSFICSLTAIEALGAFVRPDCGNGARFKEFIKDYFPAPYSPHAEKLWALRNAAVHGFSPGPFALTHHRSQAHFAMDGDRIILNAEDFYAALLHASQRYFEALSNDASLQEKFAKRAADPDTGILTVAPTTKT